MAFKVCPLNAKIYHAKNSFDLQKIASKIWHYYSKPATLCKAFSKYRSTKEMLHNYAIYRTLASNCC